MKKDIASKLQMLDLYFSKFEFFQDKNIKSEASELEIDYEINRSTNVYDNSITKIEIKTAIKNQSKTFKLNLVTVGIFSLNPTHFDESTSENILNFNTVSIMFPFISSQVSLLTTQPGLNPVQLEIIDVMKLVEKNNLL